MDLRPKPQYQRMASHADTRALVRAHAPARAPRLANQATQPTIGAILRRRSSA